jgi:hypothetical protein
VECDDMTAVTCLPTYLGTSSSNSHYVLLGESALGGIATSSAAAASAPTAALISASSTARMSIAADVTQPVA